MSVRYIFLISIVLFLLSCSDSADQPSMPPGPEDPKKNLAQLDGFADRVQFEALSASWAVTTLQDASYDYKPFGIRPLLMLTEVEINTLRSKLQTENDRACIDAIHAQAIRMQSDSSRQVTRLLASIGAIRDEMGDFGNVWADESDANIRIERWHEQKDVALKLDPLLRRLAEQRNRWAINRYQKDFLSLMEMYRGYDVATRNRLQQQVQNALSKSSDPRFPWDLEPMDEGLSRRLSQQFDSGGCLKRASFIFTLLELPESPANLQIKIPTHIPFSAFAFYPVNPPKDVRITVQPDAGITSHWSAFHEFGHAAMSLVNREKNCLTLRRPYCAAVSEGCAKVSERIFYSEEWLHQQNVSEADIGALRKWESESEIARMRSILADIEFEQVFYNDPGEDLTSQYIMIQKKTAGVDVPSNFPAWTLKRHLAFEPLARADYLLARCAQAAIYRRLRAQPGGIFGAEARRVLREDVYSTSSMSFEQWFHKASGIEPDCTAWLEDVAHVSSD